MAKKLVGAEALIFRRVLNKTESTVVDLEGDLFVIHPLREDSIISDIEKDPELRRMLERADEDIKDGKLYSTEDILEAIERGEI